MLSSIKVDSYIPQAEVCMRCHSEILDHSLSHYGRITVKWLSRKSYDVDISLHNGAIVRTPIVTESSFPETVRGYCCNDCFEELWAITWRDKNNHLRHAFDSLNFPMVTENRDAEGHLRHDNHEASPITKGLYAPHAGRHGLSGAILEESAIKTNKLQGFNRTPRTDLDLKPKQIIVRNGKWKVDPAKYPDIGKPHK